MKRRTFLQVAAAAAGAVAAGAQNPTNLVAAEAKALPAPVNGLPYRPLGRTGVNISIVGFSGFALQKNEQAKCTEALRGAFEQGVNYFDVAPAYGPDGECEKKMGAGLQGLERSRYFLACKTKARDAKGATEELERSLTRLKTDHFDVYQLHHLRKPDEVKQALGPGGCLEAILKAKEQGKVRFLGFSAHTTKAALEALKGFRFDTVMFPINYVEYFKIGFGKAVLEAARQGGAGVLAIKAMSTGAWPKGANRARPWWYRTTEKLEETERALNFALSLEPVVASFSPAWLDLVDMSIAAAKKYRRPTAEEVAQLKALAETSESVFKGEEDAVAMNLKHTPFPDYYNWHHA